ncbi:hypothetical protein [Enterococcus sp. DIV0800]|uniref:hypothetical protein n=1 Tax=unclassified Enterococcus TaxID=2608891 RepID=UPI003D2FFFB4
MVKTSEHRLEQYKNYRQRVSEDPEKKEHRNYMSSRRNARSFIRTKATSEDLKELLKLIEERKKVLNQY